MNKPRLFLDVDGVVLANYSLPGETKHFQMRPYVGSFIRWASAHFDIYWLTTHDEKSTEQICHYNDVIQFTSLEEKNKAPKNIVGVIYAPWRDLKKEQSGELNLDKVQGVINHGGLTSPWLVIENEWPCYAGYDLIHSQPDLRKNWIMVPETGPDVILELHKALKEYIKTKNFVSPWPTPPVDESAAKHGAKIFTDEVLHELKK